MIIISLRKPPSVHLWLSDQNHCQYTIASQKGYLQSIHWRSSLNFSDLSTNPDFMISPIIVICPGSSQLFQFLGRNILSQIQNWSFRRCQTYKLTHHMTGKRDVFYSVSQFFSLPPTLGSFQRLSFHVPSTEGFHLQYQMYFKFLRFIKELL